jgi:hypothetical protein
MVSICGRSLVSVRSIGARRLRRIILTVGWWLLKVLHRAGWAAIVTASRLLCRKTRTGRISIFSTQMVRIGCVCRSDAVRSILREFDADPLVLRAREICATVAVDRPDVARSFYSGTLDDGDAVQAVLRVLRESQLGEYRQAHVAKRTV